MLQILQTAGIFVGIVYYITIMRNAQRTRELTLKAQEQAKETRQAQLFMQVYNQYTMEKNKYVIEIWGWEWNNYDDYQSKYGNLESRQKMSAINSWFEGLGVLVKSDLVPLNLVASFFSGTIISHWEKVGPYILEIRVRRNSPHVHSEMEYLYKTMKAYVEEHPELKT